MSTKDFRYLYKTAIIWAMTLIVLPSVAQETQYKTFVYTSNELANEISKMNGAMHRVVTSVTSLTPRKTP